MDQWIRENEGGKKGGWRGKKIKKGLLSACKLLAPWQPRDCGICKLSEYCDPVLWLLINDS